MARPVSHGGAFTLVELVAAATLTVLVTGATAAILRSTAAARQRVQRQDLLQQEARSAMAVMAAAFRNAYRGAGDEAVLEGTSERQEGVPCDRVRLFVISRRAIRPGQPESDIKECEFFLAPAARVSQSSNGSGDVLLRRTDPTRNEDPDGGGIVEAIARNVLGLKLAYFTGSRWQDDWPKGTRGWPIAVRIELALLTEDQPPRMLTISRLVNFPYLAPQSEAAGSVAPPAGEGAKGGQEGGQNR